VGIPKVGGLKTAFLDQVIKSGLLDLAFLIRSQSQHFFNGRQVQSGEDESLFYLDERQF